MLKRDGNNFGVKQVTNSTIIVKYEENSILETVVSTGQGSRTEKFEPKMITGACIMLTLFCRER